MAVLFDVQLDADVDRKFLAEDGSELLRDVGIAQGREMAALLENAVSTPSLASACASSRPSGPAPMTATKRRSLASSGFQTWPPHSTGAVRAKAKKASPAGRKRFRRQLIALFPAQRLVQRSEVSGFKD